MAWGYGTTVEDTEVYEGQPDDPGLTVDVMNEGQITQDPIPETYRHHTPAVTGGLPFEQSTPEQPLNDQKENNKFSFYLEDGNFGAVFSDPSSPYAANFNINEQGQVGWGGSVTGESGPFNAKVGLLGQGMQFSPYANLGINPVEGLNLNVQGQSYPGGYRQVSPSASYMNQFDTPWGSVNYNIGRQGGRTVGGFQVRGDF